MRLHDRAVDIPRQHAGPPRIRLQCPRQYRHLRRHDGHERDGRGWRANVRHLLRNDRFHVPGCTVMNDSRWPGSDPTPSGLRPHTRRFAQPSRAPHRPQFRGIEPCSLASCVRAVTALPSDFSCDGKSAKPWSGASYAFRKPHHPVRSLVSSDGPVERILASTGAASRGCDPETDSRRPKALRPEPSGQAALRLVRVRLQGTSRKNSRSIGFESRAKGMASQMPVSAVFFYPPPPIFFLLCPIPATPSVAPPRRNRGMRAVLRTTSEGNAQPA